MVMVAKSMAPYTVRLPWLSMVVMMMMIILILYRSGTGACFFLHNWVDMPKELCPMFLAFDIMTKKWVKNCTGA